jgi:UDP-N-acetylglucosamine:LPS N-acetylglucosamine transferase
MLKNVFKKYDYFFLSFKREDVETRLSKEKIYFVTDPKRDPFKLLLNFFQSLEIFLKEKPDLVITTGAGVVIPFCYIAKFFGSKIIFIESLAAVFKPSFSGRIIHP